MQMSIGDGDGRLTVCPLLQLKNILLEIKKMGRVKASRTSNCVLNILAGFAKKES